MRFLPVAIVRRVQESQRRPGLALWVGQKGVPLQRRRPLSQVFDPRGGSIFLACCTATNDSRFPFGSSRQPLNQGCGALTNKARWPGVGAARKLPETGWTQDGHRNRRDATEGSFNGPIYRRLFVEWLTKRKEKVESFSLFLSGT